jgi:hypothetical protein
MERKKRNPKWLRFGSVSDTGPGSFFLPLVLIINGTRGQGFFISHPNTKDGNEQKGKKYGGSFLHGTPTYTLIDYFLRVLSRLQFFVLGGKRLKNDSQLLGWLILAELATWRALSPPMIRRSWNRDFQSDLQQRDKMELIVATRV